jgi:hypothetical protein
VAAQVNLVPQPQAVQVVQVVSILLFHFLDNLEVQEHLVKAAMVEEDLQIVVVVVAVDVTVVVAVVALA